MVEILYFCHSHILNSSLKCNVFQAVVKKKISFPSVLPPLQSSLPSPLSELSSQGTYVSPWCICVLRVRVGISVLSLVPPGLQAP